MPEAQFDHSSTAAAIQFIRDNIGDHKQFTLGTVDPDGNPWVVCANLSYDAQYNIIWKSRLDTEHSKHIANHPTVAICIFSETPERGDFGFYATAEARAVTDEAELAACLQIRYGDKGLPTPSQDRFLGASEGRIYKAELTSLWIIDSLHQKIKINLEEL